MSDQQLDTIIGKMDEIKETLELAGRTRTAVNRKYADALLAWRRATGVGDPTPGPVIPLSFSCQFQADALRHGQN